MSNDADKSLLERLQALRGSATPRQQQPAPAPLSLDLIERAKTPSRDDALAARLMRLRNQSSAPQTQPNILHHLPPGAESPPTDDAPQDTDTALQTDDGILEQLLDNGPEAAEEPQPYRPAVKDSDVRALLHDLSRSASRKDELQEDSDDSDGPRVKREVDDVIARFRDEIQLDAQQEKHADTPSTHSQESPDLALPSVPAADLLPASQPDPDCVDDITARFAALRTPAKAESDSALCLPSVPTAGPSAAAPVRRLTSQTTYTDEDIDSWCIVCLEDAGLRCLGCDADPYCARCWRDMHLGSAAAFDYKTHRAVQFSKNHQEQDEKIALGVS